MRRVRRVLWMGVAGFVLAASTYVMRGHLLTTMGSALIDSDTLVRSDAIVILSGGAPAREIEAADLYVAGLAPTVVMTVSPEHESDSLLRGRGVIVESQLEFRKRVIRSLGVPESALVILSRAQANSTKLEAELVGEWVALNRSARVIVVTSRMHTARASWIFTRVLKRLGVEVLIRAPDSDPFRADNWWHDRVNARECLFEWQKLLFYYVAYR